MGWKIFPEKSGSIMINIRVAGNKDISQDSDMGDITSCTKLRVVSPKQMQRNAERAKKHSDELSKKPDKRSCKPPDFYTDPRNKIEVPRTNDLVEQSPPKSMLSPDVERVLNVTHSSSPDPLICSPMHIESDVVNNPGDTSMISEDGFRRPPPFTPLNQPPCVPDDIGEPFEHEDFYEIMEQTECKKGHCFYSCSGQNSSDQSYDWSKSDIYVCDACFPDKKQKFCIDCINKGAHEGHRPWLRTF